MRMLHLWNINGAPIAQGTCRRHVAIIDVISAPHHVSVVSANHQSEDIRVRYGNRCNRPEVDLLLLSAPGDRGLIEAFDAG